MRTLLSTAVSATFAIGALAAPDVSLAKTPSHVPPGNCPAVAAKVGPAKTWQAVFWGKRRDLFDHPQETFVTACFTTQANCKAWLYWEQTAWPMPIVVRYCKIGMPYG